MSKREIIDKYVSKLREQQVPYDYTVRLCEEFAHEILSLPQHETSKVITNEKAKEFNCGNCKLYFDFTNKKCINCDDNYSGWQLNG